MKIFLFLILLTPCICFAEEEKSTVTIEEFLEGLSSVKGVTTRRDPFDVAKPPFVTDEVKVDNSSLPMAVKYQVESYTLVVTITGENRMPKALVRPPANEGPGTFALALGDRLGNRGGRVIEIAEGRIVVLQNQRTPLGFVDKARIVLAINKDPSKKSDGTLISK